MCVSQSSQQVDFPPGGDGRLGLSRVSAAGGMGAPGGWHRGKTALSRNWNCSH